MPSAASFKYFENSENISLLSVSYMMNLHYIHSFIVPYFLFRRFRVYFQQIICCCCFRLWKSRLTENNLSPKGILLEKNSHSDPGRSRSCKFRSVSDFYCQISHLLHLKNDVLIIKIQNHIPEGY